MRKSVYVSRKWLHSFKPQTIHGAFSQQLQKRRSHFTRLKIDTKHSSKVDFHFQQDSVVCIFSLSPKYSPMDGLNVWIWSFLSYYKYETLFSVSYMPHFCLPVFDVDNKVLVWCTLFLLWASVRSTVVVGVRVTYSRRQSLTVLLICYISLLALCLPVRANVALKRPRLALSPQRCMSVIIARFPARPEQERGGRQHHIQYLCRWCNRREYSS